MRKSIWGVRACCPFVLCAMAAIALPAQTFTTLHSFNGTDGSIPEGALVQATNGTLFGTAGGGGRIGHCGLFQGCGTVFQVIPGGMLKALYSFCHQDGCTDGNSPLGGLIQGTDGSFYGTTADGGANGRYDGTVFKINPTGALTTLYSFCSQGNCTDGANPEGALVQGTDGSFYGTTTFGGQDGAGTVFKITPNGVLTTLHSFKGTDGATPIAGLILGADGYFYGTTGAGGNFSSCPDGCGSVFRMTASGTLVTLYDFESSDGITLCPGQLVQGTDGNFYGTTEEGGNNSCQYGCGAVFKITEGGTMATLHNFDGTDGGNPRGALIQATDGNFYGTTVVGGVSNFCVGTGCGTIFKVTPGGTLTTLYSFCAQTGDSCPDGFDPFAGLVQDTDGSFYGTTGDGGSYCCFGYGTVFNLSVGLGPFVKTNPVVGKVGSAVSILGSNLTGATKVIFHGTAATFQVVSATEITTTVPTGATTGTVRVVTPSATLSSNVPFKITT